MRGVLGLVLAALLLTGCGETEPGPEGTATPEQTPVLRDRPEKEQPPLRRWEPAEPIQVIPWRPATSARDLADRLWVAEHQARAPYNLSVVTEAAGFECQLLYRQLARTPEWQDEVIRRMRGLGEEVRLHIEARTSLRSVLTTLSPELPAWEVVPSAPAPRLLAYYREAEREYGVEWELLAAVNLVESSWGKIRGLSTAGAQGPMQFMPETWAAYGEGDVTDPHDAIMGAANYLAASGAASGDVEGALYAYNNHPGYVAGISAYAEILRRDPAALRGLYGWQVVYLSTIGDIWLPVGYHETAPVPVEEYVDRNPDQHLGSTTG